MRAGERKRERECVCECMRVRESERERECVCAAAHCSMDNRSPFLGVSILKTLSS